MSQFAGASAEVQDCLARVQVGPFCGPAPPGMVAGDAEETIPGVVAGCDRVEHLPDLIGPRFLPHATNYLRRPGLQVGPRLRRRGGRSTVIPA